LDDLLLEAGILVPRETQHSVLEYLDVVIELNTSLNLTRIVSPDSAVRLHVLDSLVALPEVSSAPAGTLLDIGTGGGFPGVVLCLASTRDGILLDSVGKKARAVNTAISALGATETIRALPERAEEHARSHGQEYAVVTARAVSELPALVELAAPLLLDGGRLIALKGAPEDRELQRARAVGSKVGMRELSVRRLILPGGDESRCIVTYQRSGVQHVRLPRKNGAAQNSPLA
jgi:16S rRNA (guanine527-N7)-methyltransferase